MRFQRDIFINRKGAYVPFGQLVFQTSADGHVMLDTEKVSKAMSLAAVAFQEALREE